MPGLLTRGTDIEREIDKATGATPPSPKEEAPAPPKKPGFFERLNPFAKQKAQVQKLREEEM